MGERNLFLLPNEAEAYIESLSAIDVLDIGSPKWRRQHQLIYKLSVQASYSVKCNDEEEFVKDLFVSIGKVAVLIHELIAVDVWKEKVLPEIFKQDFHPASTVPLYTVLYHEATVASLLGSLLFHEDVIESASEVLIDLIDYCNRKLVSLFNKDTSDKNKHHEMNEHLIELVEKEETLSFYIGINSISFICHITQHLKMIPLSVLHRILNIHDIPMIFANLLYEKPWQRQSPDGNVEIYSNSGWIKAKQSQLLKLSHVEGQVWITFLQLLLNQECLRKYEITTFRKHQLLKLKAKINEILIEQLPLLKELLLFLEHLNLFQPPAAKHDLIIEQVPEIRHTLMKRHKRMWREIAEKQVTKWFMPSKSELDEFYKELSETYDTESLEAILPDVAKCAACFKRGDKKCARCKSEWYCARKCQVEHWSKHKPLCDLLVEQKNKI